MGRPQLFRMADGRHGFKDSIRSIQGEGRRYLSLWTLEKPGHHRAGFRTRERQDPRIAVDRLKSPADRWKR